MAARKRGGLAGVYDRNKKLIKTVAPIAAGFIPGIGPALGAALGAAMGGDTEGKGYFSGFNAGGAVKGGLSGYGGAKLGQAAKGGLAKMFTASPVNRLTGAPKLGALTQTTSGAAPVMPGIGATAGAAPTAAYTGNVGGYGIGMPLGSAAPVSSSAIGDKPLSGFAKASKFAKENKDLIAMAGKSVQALLPDAASDAAYMNAETNRMRLEEEQNQEKTEQERRRRTAELLLPMFTQMQSRQPYGYGG
jgi:hypothetical protein